MLTVGVGGGYGQDLNSVGKDGTKLYATSTVGAAYASLHPGSKLYVDAALGYASLDYALTRFSSEASAFAKGDRSGDQVFGSITAAWDHRMGALHLSPYGRWEGMTANLGAYTEAGAGMYALAYRSQTVQTSTGSVGLRADYLVRASYGLWKPKAWVEFAHDFQKAATQDILYADMLGGQVYTARGDAFARSRAKLGLGADLKLSESLSVSGEYRAEAGEKQFAQGLSLTGRVRF